MGHLHLNGREADTEESEPYHLELRVVLNGRCVFRVCGLCFVWILCVEQMGVSGVRVGRCGGTCAPLTLSSQ